MVNPDDEQIKSGIVYYIQSTKYDLMLAIKISIALMLATTATKAQTPIDSKVVVPQRSVVLPDTFKNVLNLAQMTFTMPKEAIPIPLVKNMQMHYEYAITFKDKPFEVRYAVAPIGYSVAEAYTGGKGITPRKENEMMSRTSAVVIAINVGGGKPGPNMGSKDFRI